MTVRREMKKKLLFSLVLLAAILCLAVTVLADNDPLSVSIQLSANKLSGPKTITVSVRVSNSGEGDMPGPVTLYYPNGEQVKEFGSPTLSVGASHEWTGSVQVTQKMLQAGKITFSIRYGVFNENGELVNKRKAYSKKLIYSGAVASLDVNRTINPTVAGKGQKVTVTYELINSGNVDITDVEIREHASISAKTAKIGTVKAGSKETYSFTAEMGKSDLTSQSTITYKASGKTQTIKKEAASVKYAEVKLTASMSCDTKGGLEGSAAKLTVTLKNTSDKDYTNVTLVEPTLGTLASGLTVPAKSSITVDKDLTITETASYQVTVTGTSGDGMDVSTATGPVEITMMKPEEALDLTVTATADRTEVYTIPATVRFTISVTNNGTIGVEKIGVYAVDQRLRSISEIPPGETKTFVVDTDISMAGTFMFNARGVNALNEVSRFDSNQIQIAHVSPTAVPTEAPVVTVPAPQYVDVPTADDLDTEEIQRITNLLGIAKYVLAGLTGIMLILVLLGIIGTIRRHRVTNVMESEGTRSYYTDQGKHRAMIEDEEPAVMPADEEEIAAPDTVEEAPVPETDSDAMAEALARIYSTGAAEAPAAADAPTVTVEDEAPAAEQDSHRRSHRS